MTFILFGFSPVFLTESCDTNPRSDLASAPSSNKKKKNTEATKTRLCSAPSHRPPLPTTSVTFASDAGVRVFFLLLLLFLLSFFAAYDSEAMDSASLRSVLHCHAVRMARAERKNKNKNKKNRDLAKSCRERRLWRAQRFGPQSALPYLPQKHREVGVGRWGVRDCRRRQ